MKSGCNGAGVGHLIEEVGLDQVHRIKVAVIGVSSITNRIVDVKHLAFN